MTLEVIEQRINSHESEYGKYKEFIFGELKEIKGKVDGLEESKMSSKTFWIIMPLIATAIFGVLGYIVSIVNETRQTTVVTQIDVSTIKGRLDPYEIKFEK